MDFKSFSETIKDLIRDYLPEEYKNASIEIMEQTKLNEQYMGLTVRKEDQTIAPTVNLNALYEAYEKGNKSISLILSETAKLVQMEPDGIDLSVLFNYEKAKEHLFIRVSNLETNRDKVADAPHVIHEDLVVTYHIATDLNSKGIASTMVTNSMLRYYGITQEQLHIDAMKSAPELLPARVESMDAVMHRMMMEEMKASGLSQEEMDAILADMPIIEQTPMTVVTNEHTMNGAAVFFYPDQMDKIAEQLGGDYFILPSSVHELLVIPDNGKFDHEGLRGMVQEVNATQVMPKDRLADEVYHYDSKDRVFEKAEKFEERQKAKTQERQDKLDKGEKLQEHGAAPKAQKKHKSNDMSL